MGPSNRPTRANPQVPEWGVLLARGIRKRCPRCGAKPIYESWFRMYDRCPACGFQFEREPGFFVGAYTINLALVEGLLFAMVMGFVFWKAGHPDAGVGRILLAALLAAVVTPLVTYPYARSIWS